MLITLSKNPKIAIPLSPYLLDVDKTKQDVAVELAQRLRCAKESTFCAVVTAQNKLMGYLLAYVDSDEVFVWQANSRPGFKYSKIVFGGMEYWARSKGIHKLRSGMADMNLAKFMEHRYGFRITGNYINGCPEVVKEI